MEQLRGLWGKLNKRERFLVIGVALSILFYITYNMMLEKTFTQVMMSRREFAKVSAEYKTLLIYHQRLEQLRKEQKALEETLVKKKVEETRFMEGLKARHHLDKLLLEMQSTAKKMPMKLMDLEIATNTITRSKDYQRQVVQSITESLPTATGGDKNAPKGNTETVKVSYTQNQIKLRYRSSYQTTVKYLLRIVEMPYAISIISVDMKMLEVAGAGSEKKDSNAEAYLKGATEGGSKSSQPSFKAIFSKGEIVLETIIELEVFYR